MVQMFPYLLLPNSQLYSSVAAAAIARWEGAGMQLYKIFIMIVKNYYHYYRYLTYLSLLFITYLQENVDVNFNVNESIEVCLCEVNKTS